MIAYAGMSDRLPNVCYYNNNEYSFQRPYSETTAKIMDDEVLKMINGQYERAKQLLTEHKEGHAKLAKLLVEREVIFAEDVEKIFGKRPWASRSEELLEAQQRAEAEAMAEHRAKELEAQGKQLGGGGEAGSDGGAQENGGQPALPGAGSNEAGNDKTTNEE